MPLLILVTLLSLKKPNSLPTESFSINHPDITPIFYFISYSKTQLWRMTVLCCCLVTQSCLTLCDPMNCSLSGSSVHRISPLFIRTQEWVVISFSRGSSWCRDWNSLAGGFFTAKQWEKYDCILPCTHEKFISQVASECVCVCVCVCTYIYYLCLLNREVQE